MGCIFPLLLPQLEHVLSARTALGVGQAGRGKAEATPTRSFRPARSRGRVSALKEKRAMTELGLILAISVLGLAFAGYLIKWVLARDTGTPAMREVSDAIKAGAEAFLRRQNKTIATMAAGLACVIFIIYGFVRQHESVRPHRHGLELAFWTTLSFVLGAICSVAAGYVGMWVSIRTNVRAAAGARTSLNDALQIALRGGAVSGLFVVAMSLLGVAGLFGIIFAVKGGFSGNAGAAASRSRPRSR